jgi:hypothetical protein
MEQLTVLPAVAVLGQLMLIEFWPHIGAAANTTNIDNIQKRRMIAI